MSALPLPAGDQDRRSFRAEALEIAKTLGAGLAIALVLRVVVFQPYTIPSSSMEPGLLTGDYIVVSKWSYGWSRHALPFSPPLPGGRLFGRAPERGDVVVFKLPRDHSQTLIKRIVGLPGDRVQVRAGRVFVNGWPVAQTPLGSTSDPDNPDITVAQVRETLPNGRSYVTFDRGPGHAGDDTEVFVVPQDAYFALGDNRDNSLDSRWPKAVGVGFIPADNLVGKARIVLASWTGGASILDPWTWVARFDPGRIAKPIG